MIRVVLPAHLRTLASVDGEVSLDLPGGGAGADLATVIDALEARFPPLLGTMRDRVTGRRRPFVRFFIGEEDYSHADPSVPLPPSVLEGRDAFCVVGAMAGG